MTLDERINFLWAVATNQGKEKVKEKFIEYCNAYDSLKEVPKFNEKVRHRYMFEKYFEYMSNLEKGEDNV